MFIPHNRSIRLLTLAIAALALSVLVIGCGDDETSTSGAAATTKPSISDVWARTTAEAAKTGAIYMTIKGSDQADKLTAAAVDESIAGETQIHEVVSMSEAGETAMDDHSMAEGEMDSGEMMMREVDAIDIPAGGSVVLKPGGYHVMLLELKGPIEAGDKIAVTLTFEKAGDVKVEATARDATEATHSGM